MSGHQSRGRYSNDGQPQPEPITKSKPVAESQSEPVTVAVTQPIANYGDYGGAAATTNVCTIFTVPAGGLLPAGPTFRHPDPAARYTAWGSTGDCAATRTASAGCAATSAANCTTTGSTRTNG